MTFLGGVRARSTVIAAAVALLVSTSMALLTFQLTRSYLTGQRDRLAARQAYLNARILQDALAQDQAERTAEALGSLSREGGSQVLLRLDDRWLGSSVGVGEDDLPPDARRVVAQGSAARQRAVIDGRPHVVVGVPLLDNRAAFFELFPLVELERTLRTMAAALAGSAAITTVVGALLGATFSGRVLRPLVVTAHVARRVADGDLQLRLPTGKDREVAPIFDAFNGMVDALSERIERERRFAADVSHELRTPLTALIASAAVLEREHDQLPARAQLAVEILAPQLDHFRRLVLDLLDMARMESGAEQANLEPVNLVELVERLTRSRPMPHPAVLSEGLEGPVLLDGPRLERVLVNLLDNADAYAGGAVRLTVRRSGDRLRLIVDDSGRGVSKSERQAIFERLHRGEAGRASEHRGSGLGLALATESLRLQGGTICVQDSPEGGARFTVDLPYRPAGTTR